MLKFQWKYAFDNKEVTALQSCEKIAVIFSQLNDF